MLNQVECTAAAQPAAHEPPASAKTVWVYSKAQAPYEFRMWMDPCSPHEWPYNLQGMRGTEDYDDIVAWYLSRHPDISPTDLDLLLEVLVQCVGERQISVSVYHDIDTGSRHLWFTVWELTWQEASARMDRFQDLHLSMPALTHMLCKVGFSTRSGRFEHRHLTIRE